MDRRYCGHHSEVMMSKRAQRTNLTGMVHAHFNHSQVVLSLKLQQLQWKSDMIVEIARALHHAEARGKNVRQNLLGGGLACRACHSQQRLAPKPARRRAQKL